MFEKTLQDVVKGIRANKRDPSDYISATIADIKMELKSSDAFIKAQAVSRPPATQTDQNSSEMSRAGKIHGINSFHGGVDGLVRFLPLERR